MKLILIFAVAAAVLFVGCSNDLLEPEQFGRNSSSKGNVKSPTTTMGKYEINTTGGVSTVYLKTGRNSTWVATFTPSTRTVTMSGDARSFTENNLSVNHNTWVRLLTSPFNGSVDTAWISARLAENVTNTNVPDILEMAMDYLDDGSLDAKYGPDNTLDEGSDWSDYLGVDHQYVNHWSWSLQKYTNWTHVADNDRLGALDCSGFIRMVYGYRGGIPMMYNPDPNNPSSLFPRRSYQMWDSCIGKKVMTGYQFGAGDAEDKLALVRIGDLVLFNADTSTTTEKWRIDHVGMYLGEDQNGNMRFMHSRSTSNRGPSFNFDGTGKSIINDDGTDDWLYYAKALVGARRL